MKFTDLEIVNCEVHCITTLVHSDYSTEIISDVVLFKGKTIEQCQLFIDTF